MRKEREEEVKVGLGSGTLLLDADAARGLDNPRRLHLSYSPPRYFPLATQSLGRGPVTGRLWNCVPSKAGCWYSMGASYLERLSL